MKKKKLTSTGWIFIFLGALFIAVGSFVTITGIAGIVGTGTSVGDTYEVAEGGTARFYGLAIVGFGIYCFFQAFSQSKSESKDDNPKFGFKK